MGLRLICAVVFIAMGGLPLASGIAWRDDVREGIVAAQLETSGFAKPVPR